MTAHRRTRAWTALLPPGLRPDPLGDGVWGRAARRTERAVSTYQRVVDGTARDVGRPPSGAAQVVLAELRLQAVRLVEVRTDVTRRAEDAQRDHPSDDLDVPRGDRQAALHRRLSRVGTLCAQAAQAATMSRVLLRSEPTPEAAREAVRSVGRTVDQAVAELRGGDPAG